jgi:hypothetical protein
MITTLLDVQKARHNLFRNWLMRRVYRRPSTFGNEASRIGFEFFGLPPLAPKNEVSSSNRRTSSWLSHSSACSDSHNSISMSGQIKSDLSERWNRIDPMSHPTSSNFDSPTNQISFWIFSLLTYSCLDCAYWKGFRSSRIGGLFSKINV